LTNINLFVALLLFLLPQTPHHKHQQQLSHRHNQVKKVEMMMTVTSYSLRGRTATGSKPKIGTAAVDPRVIPLGTILFIPGYGWARAEDTGSAIKGHKIDVWLPSRSQALKWGRKKLKVKVFIR
jgi:3D (Asp-Asp-Asp) domain-containing protein